jgi:hypothetical protein
MIIFKKKKLIYTDNTFKKTEKREVKSFIPYLKEEVQLDDNFTLEDLFYFIEKDKALVDIVFSSHLGHFPIQSFIRDIKKSVPKGFKEEEVKYLEVYWVCTTEEDEDGKHSFDFYTGFHGQGKTFDKYANKEIDTGFAIEYSPLSQLKKIQLKLNTEVSIFQTACRKNKYKYKTLFKGEKGFTVYDFISTILDEISFCGAPKNREKKIKTIIKGINKIRKSIKDGKTCFKKFKDIKKDK